MHAVLIGAWRFFKARLAIINHDNRFANCAFYMQLALLIKVIGAYNLAALPNFKLACRGKTPKLLKHDNNRDNADANDQPIAQLWFIEW